MIKKASPQFLGFLQATGVAVYLILLSFYFLNLENMFRNKEMEFYAPIIMLLTFIISAVTTSTLVLGRVAMLFWNKQFKESFTLLGWTLGWIVFYLAMFIVINLVR